MKKTIKILFVLCCFLFVGKAFAYDYYTTSTNPYNNTQTYTYYYTNGNYGYNNGYYNNYNRYQQRQLRRLQRIANRQARNYYWYKTSPHRYGYYYPRYHRYYNHNRYNNNQYYGRHVASQILNQLLWM